MCEQKLIFFPWSGMESFHVAVCKVKVSFRGVQRGCNVTYHGVPVFSAHRLDACTSIRSNSVGWGNPERAIGLI
jgi:hypothetical protein